MSFHASPDGHGGFNISPAFRGEGSAPSGTGWKKARGWAFGVVTILLCVGGIWGLVGVLRANERKAARKQLANAEILALSVKPAGRLMVKWGDVDDQGLAHGKLTGTYVVRNADSKRQQVKCASISATRSGRVVGHGDVVPGQSDDVFDVDGIVAFPTTAGQTYSITRH